MMSEEKSAVPQRSPSRAADYYRGKARCPWCDSKNVELASLFGGTVSELLFQCRDCQSAFGVMKWETLDDAHG